MQIQASAPDAGCRLDVWLDRRLPGLSRSRIQSLIQAGRITVDGKPVRAHRRVTTGMTVRIRVPPPSPARPEPEDIPLDVLFEDGAILVVNKPAGLVVHPAAGHASGTLVNALLHRCADLAGIGGERRPGIVHRLDRDTSGALVVAKNDRAMAGLTAAFKAGAVRKEYLALVYGIPEPASGRIETRIGRSPHDRKKMSARPAGGAGRRAVTHYEVLEAFAGAALVRVRIETGRTHQIRVHMAHVGHPVLGDRQYGGRRRAAVPGVERQMLHAQLLAFRHPVSGRPMQFEAPLPDDLAGVLGVLRCGI